MPRAAVVALGWILVALGVVLLVASPLNNAFEGWGMLTRALAGHALVVFGVDRLARARVGRPRAATARARRLALLVSSILLFPFAAFLFLMSKEGGSSWQLASLLLVGWLLVAGAYATLALVVPFVRGRRDRMRYPKGRHPE